jgi:cellulose synthase/poly-beta-1,6-N-acetylglucosamine synthase-like glycosyltransferase
VRVVQLSRGFPGAARNAGVRAAKSDWIAFVDAGMRLSPDWLSALARPVIADPSVDCVLGGLEPVADSRMRRAAALAFVPARRPTPDGGGAWRGFCLPSSLIRRERVLAVGGFPEALRSGEDLVFYRSLASRCKIAYAPEAIVCWTHASTPTAVWRRFRSYAEHSFKAGLMKDWFDVVARRYAIMAALSGPFLPLAAPMFLLTRAAVLQRRKPEFSSAGLAARLVQAFEVSFYLGIIDLATARAWLDWRAAGRPRVVQDS